jgi:hypothetical protein
MQTLERATDTDAAAAIGQSFWSQPRDRCRLLFASTAALFRSHQRMTPCLRKKCDLHSLLRHTDGTSGGVPSLSRRSDAVCSPFLTSKRAIAISRQLIAGSVMRGFGQLPEKWKSKSLRNVDCPLPCNNPGCGILRGDGCMHVRIARIAIPAEVAGRNHAQAF